MWFCPDRTATTAHTRRQLCLCLRPAVVTPSGGIGSGARPAEPSRRRRGICDELQSAASGANSSDIGLIHRSEGSRPTTEIGAPVATDRTRYGRRKERVIVLTRVSSVRNFAIGRFNMAPHRTPRGSWPVARLRHPRARSLKLKRQDAKLAKTPGHRLLTRRLMPYLIRATLKLISNPNW
jgi:hypothetical protein